MWAHCIFLTHIYTVPINTDERGRPEHLTSHSVPIKAWASSGRNTEGKGSVDMTGPYGDPTLAPACYFRTIRWHDNQTCRTCHHQSPSLCAFCKALASMEGGLFSQVLLRSASLMRQQAAGRMSPLASCSRCVWSTYSSSPQSYKGCVCKPSTGRWGIPCCPVPIFLLNHSPHGHLHGCPTTMTHIQGKASQEGLMEPTGPNGAVFCQETQGLACPSPHDNPVGPGFRTVHLGTIICCKTQSQRCRVPHILTEC